MIRLWLLPLATLASLATPWVYYWSLVALWSVAPTLKRDQVGLFQVVVLGVQTTIYLATITAYAEQKEWFMFVLLAVLLPFQTFGVLMANLGACGLWGGNCL